MTSMACSRCGRVTDVEYGNDGQAYCSSCIFYGTNKQCWKCRMYLPSSELQQYRGMWVCPYCLQDMRDETRRMEEREEKKEKVAQVVSYPETCERCGRELASVVYIWNGKRLCKSCLDEEKDKWDLVGGGPSGAPYRISIEPVKKSKAKSLLELAISGIRGLLGMKSRKPIDQEYPGRSKMPIDRAKPMVEKKVQALAVQSKEEDKPPQIEGIFTRRQIAPFKREPEGKGLGSEKGPETEAKKNIETALSSGKTGSKPEQVSAGEGDGSKEKAVPKPQVIPKKANNQPGAKIKKTQGPKKRRKKGSIDEEKIEEDIENDLGS